MGETTTHTFPMGVCYPLGSMERLRWMLERVQYKPGWTFGIQAHGGDWKSILIRVETNDPVSGKPMLVDHSMLIPPVPYTDEEWERWLLDQILLVERHEACEFLTIDNHRPFFPQHGTDTVDPKPYAIIRRRRASLDA